MPLDYFLNKYFPISVCENCGHGLTEETSLKDLQSVSLYEGGSYDIKEGIWHRLASPFLIFLERNKIKYLRDHENGKRLLEIGCGKGRFLEIAKRRGYEVYGLEPSVRSNFFARMRLGDVVFPVELEHIDEIQKLNGCFNVIVMWHVMEHIPELDMLMRKIKERLARSGIILVALPNMASYQSKIGKEDWYHLDPPRHLHHFTPQSFKFLMEKHGLKVEQIYYNSFYQNFIGEIITVTNKLLPDKNVIFNLMKLNNNYIKRVGWGRSFFMLIIVSLISLSLLIPMLFWTFITQIKDKAGTMVFIVKQS